MNSHDALVPCELFCSDFVCSRLSLQVEISKYLNSHKLLLLLSWLWLLSFTANKAVFVGVCELEHFGGFRMA